MYNTRNRIGRILVKSLALLASQMVVHAGPEKGAGHAAFPAVNLPAVVRGHNAVQSLGGHLPDVARAYGIRQEELEALLIQDPTLTVDRKGRLHYVEPTFQAGALADSTVPQEALAPLADTFKLHSRGGAKRILYLDFDGHLLSGTGWNTSYNAGRDIVAPAWDIDGDPTTFSADERTRIQQIWQRVAEDYAPFDVDVTTELSSESQITRSSLSDEYYGTRVLISRISQYFGQYGGIAYIGAFDDVGDTYKPALVFPENLGPNGEKYIAEAASHEAGHNLGLNHDGTATAGYYEGQGSGVTGWAPIMGAAYYENVTQWSKGEYAGANNKQDDLAVMQTYGLPVRADDFGNTAATASFFPAGTQLSAVGIIERSTDVDVFGFTTGAGNVRISISGSDLGPNLDIYAEVRDANGTLVAANNPADQLNALLDLSLSAGTYYLHVRGTGLGDPLTTGYTSYGSLGQYFIVGTVIDSGVVNSAPVARATASPSTGTAPLAVTFDGSTSSDADGSIASYQWNFGDGSTGSGAVVQHSYQSAGDYTATLTVTDNAGATASTTVLIQATQVTTPSSMRVQSISLVTVTQGAWKSVRATVRVTDLNGNPVSGATVSGSFNSVVSGTATGTTDASGQTVLTSRRVKTNGGTVTFTVNGLAKSGYTYSASQNLQNSATILIGQ
jgi:PKD repeat protein